MIGLAQWYLLKLRTHPLVANCGSALVIMGIGDSMAQVLERYHLDDAVIGESKPNHDHIPIEQRVQFRRYGIVPHPSTDKAEDSQVQYPSTIWWNKATDTIASLDTLRTASMMAWAVCCQTPAILLLYNFMDRIFPVKTAATVAARVCMGFCYAIPLSAGFFIYGTIVHHTAEWVALRNEWRQEMSFLDKHSNNAYQSLSPPPFDWEMMWTKAKLKVQSELWSAMFFRAKLVPFNAFNFAVVPSHLRPVGLMFITMFWNCYLSLLHHRDSALPMALLVKANHHD